MSRRLSYLLVFVLFVFMAVPLTAQDDEPEFPPAETVNDQGGAVVVTGTLTISNPNVIDASFNPIIILEDQTGFVMRDFDYVFPPESQVIAAFTSPFQVGDITFSLSLPAVPNGGMNDVDNDGEEDMGVQIFQIGYWDDQWGGAFVDERDGTGWSGAQSTVAGSINPETLGEYLEGNLIVWAPDDKQGFPAGFGEDGFLFTEDDEPMVTLPAGYTIVNLDTEPFTFDRSREVDLPLIEPDSAVPDDFSALSYAEAFNALVDKAIREYPGTELKNIDWEALREEFLPRFEEADANGDVDAYILALQDFAWSIPDGHIAFGDPTGVTNAAFTEDTNGGLGFAATETTDGRFLVSFVLEGGPAEEAGMELLAELIEVNGMPVEEAMVAEEIVWSAPFSDEANARVQQLRYLLSAPVGTDYTVTFQNPDADAPETVDLTTIPERDSFGSTSVLRNAPDNPPQISFEFLENNIGYIQVSGFGGNGPYLIETWEAFIAQAIRLGSPGIIVDLRYNGGGFSFLGNRMASYFFEEETPMYFGYGYNDEIDQFWSFEDFPAELLPPLNPSLVYGGEVAVMVSQACASACEYFGYALSFEDRATIIGQYGTNAIAFGWIGTAMPEGVTFALPTSGSLDFDGNFIIEGTGLPLDVQVPVNEETILDPDRDWVLEAALEYMEEASQVELVEGGEINIGDSIEGELEPGVRVRYTFTAAEAFDAAILAASEDGTLDTYIRIYVVGNEDTPAVESDDLEGLSAGWDQLNIPADLPIIIEVGGFGDNETGTFTLTLDEFVPPEVTIEEGGTIVIGDIVEGELAEGLRIAYTFEVEEDAVIDISLGDEAGTLDTYLRVYVDGAEEPTFENDDIELGVQTNSLLEGVEVSAGQTLTIEVGGFGDTAEGSYTLTITESAGE